MDKNLMDALYVEHDGKIGVLSSDERKVVSQSYRHGFDACVRQERG